ncbi:MAG: hypothetical protein JXB04_10675 [Kiritimatiellae bacterium]|nr:hypothetical protein [Kiritimatiellia bacterium]
MQQLAWEDEMMELRCKHVSADEAGDEVFRVIFEAKHEQEDGPYLLISRAFLEEDEGEAAPIYVETQDERLIGHYPSVGAELTRDRFTLTLPAPASETINVHFKASDKRFRKIVRILGIILQTKLTVGEREGANTASHDTALPRRP